MGDISLHDILGTRRRIAAVEPNGDGVVVLHGIARDARSMASMSKALEAKGYRVLNLDYPSREMTIAESAGAVAEQITAFAKGCRGEVHFVGHSMGGLVARVYVTRWRPVNFGKMVHLGTPNQGSEVADLLKDFVPYQRGFGPAGQDLVTAPSPALLEALGVVDYPLGVIAGNRTIDLVSSAILWPEPNDGKVTVERSRADGMADHIVLPTTHTFMMRNRRVQKQVLWFLKHGVFEAE